MLNAKALIEKKGLLKDRQSEVFDVEVKGVGTFKFRTPSEEDILDANNLEGREVDAYLLYNCCVEPDLSDDELNQAFGTMANKPEIVGKIFKPGEITSIAEILMKKSGFDSGSVRLVDDIKN